MTIKLMLLKSGEDIIADVSEMTVGEEDDKRVVGYFLNKPCVVKMRQPELLTEQSEGPRKKAGYEVSLFPWMPLAVEEAIPVVADWIITMVDPVIKLKQIIGLIPGKIVVIRLKTTLQNQNVELAKENEQEMLVKKRPGN